MAPNGPVGLPPLEAAQHEIGRLKVLLAKVIEKLPGAVTMELETGADIEAYAQTLLGIAVDDVKSISSDEEAGT